MFGSCFTENVSSHSCFRFFSLFDNQVSRVLANYKNVQKLEKASKQSWTLLPPPAKPRHCRSPNHHHNHHHHYNHRHPNYVTAMCSQYNTGEHERRRRRVCFFVFFVFLCWSNWLHPHRLLPVKAVHFFSFTSVIIKLRYVIKTKNGKPKKQTLTSLRGGGQPNLATLATLWLWKRL